MAVHIGPAFPADRHRHFAVQLLLAADSTFRIRSHPEDAWQQFTAAVVCSNAWHEFDAPPSLLPLVFLDPVSHISRRILGLGDREAGVFPIPPAVATPLVVSLSTVQLEASAIRSAVVTFADACPVRALPRVDERIRQALEILGRHPDRILSLEEVAEQVGLSADRFRHLFREQTGTTFSAYRLWNRVVHAARLLAMTSDLTQAAHASGFSDSAHFSRTFRLAFGLRPSEVFKSGDFRLILCE